MFSFISRSSLGHLARSLFPGLMGLGSRSGPCLKQTTGSGPDYLFFGVIDWHYRLQRPQHLACELGRLGRRVFYISCNFVNRTSPGFRVETLEPNFIYQIFLNLRQAPSIYFRPPTAAELNQMSLGLHRLMNWSGTHDKVCLVQHPFWSELACRVSPQKLVYDRMDIHDGFLPDSDSEGRQALIETEHSLMKKADITICTSKFLDDEAATYSSKRLLLRNAADFKHFSVRPMSVFQDSSTRRVIGYFGAINHWLDLELIAALASAFPDCLILLIGHDQCQAARYFSSYANIHMMGELPYDQLPFYLHGFDVCILPFRRIPLTLATNPVKVYEYLSAGKPIVAISLPELELLTDLIILARNQREFLFGIAEALAENNNDSTRCKRMEFAALHTWSERARKLLKAVEDLP